MAKKPCQFKFENIIFEEKDFKKLVAFDLMKEAQILDLASKVIGMPIERISAREAMALQGSGFSEWASAITPDVIKSYMKASKLDAIQVVDRLASYWLARQGSESTTNDEYKLDYLINKTPIKAGVEELFESNPELANAVYEALGLNTINESEITYTDEEGNLCAKMGGRSSKFTKGGKWKVIKDLKGYPSHKEGGVDLTISKDGVSIKNGNTQFTAKHGLVIPKAQDGMIISKSQYKPTKAANPSATYLSIPNKVDFYSNEKDLDSFFNNYKRRKNLNGYLTDYGKDSKGEYISLYKRDGNSFTNLFSTPNEYYDRIYKSDLDNLKTKRFNDSFDNSYKKKDYTTLKDMIIPDNNIKELEQPSYEEQRQWFMNYVKSPLYKEILLNEYKQSGKDIKTIDSDILNRYNRIKNVPIEEVKIHPKGYGYIRGITYLSENNPNEINNQTGKSDNIYNQTNPKGWGKYQIGNIHLDPDVKFLDTYIAGHELTHKSTEGNKYLTDFAKNKLLSSVNKDDTGTGYTDKKLNKSYNYYDNPTEVHARLSELKYMMHYYGIYNPIKEKMTKDHLIKAMENPYIRKSLDFDTLLDMLQNKGDIIDLMNTIAQNKTDNQNQLG